MNNEKELLSPYAPIRYRTGRWWNFAMQVTEHHHVSADGKIHQSLPDMILEQCVYPMAQRMKAALEGHPDIGNVMGLYLAKTLELRHWIPMAGQYELCGRQIFDLTDSLVDMLKHTDLGECSLDGWNAPYDAFYVRFGMQEEMKLPYEEDGYNDTFEYLDGAFVAVTPWNDISGEKRLKFGFTTVKSNGMGMSMPGYYIDLTPTEQSMPVMDSIDAAIKRRAAEFTKGGSDNEKALNAHRLDVLNDSAELMRKASALLINALFYIESMQGKTGADQTEPGRDTPIEKAVEWLQAKPEKRRKLRSRLTSEGYAIVRLMGKEMEPSAGHARANGTMRTHWRRGHWRQQRVGPQRSLIERRWIKPTIVNATNQDVADTPGHIYAVGTANGSDYKH